MLTDYRVLAILLIQSGVSILLAYGTFLGFRAIRLWQPEQPTARQLNLERETFLVSMLTEVAFLANGMAFISFLVFVNHALIDFLRGAMCAEGVLSTNAYGHWALYLKIALLFATVPFAALNAQDKRNIAAIFTPHKFYWLLLPLGLSLADCFFTFCFFANIEPYVLTACCSSAFTKQNGLMTNLLEGSRVLEALVVYVVLAFYQLGAFTFKWRQPRLNLFLALCYAAAAIYSWRYFFTRYFYGVEGHYCLHDSFQEAHGGLGYLIFAGLFYFLAHHLALGVLSFYQNDNLETEPLKFYTQAHFWAFATSWLIPLWAYISETYIR